MVASIDGAMEEEDKHAAMVVAALVGVGGVGVGVVGKWVC